METHTETQQTKLSSEAASARPVLRKSVLLLPIAVAQTTKCDGEVKQRNKQRRRGKEAEKREEGTQAQLRVWLLFETAL